MQLPPFVTQALGRVAYEFARLQPFIPMYLHLLTSAVFPIFTGAHSSLSRPASAAKRGKRTKKEDLDESEDEDEEPVRMEGLSPSDAVMFPILAGCTLAGLYFLIKWLQDPAILNKILNAYFALFSVFSVARLVSDGLDVVHSLIFPHDYVDRGILYRVKPKAKLAIPDSHDAQVPTKSTPLPGLFSRIPLSVRAANLLWVLHVLPSRKVQINTHIKRILDLKVNLGLHGFVGFLAGLITVMWFNFVSKPWFLTNIMGFGFAYGTLQILSPTTFATGSLILGGLFFYDIYFVFYTPMMVTVAKSLDIPVKLLFPRPPEPPEISLDPSKTPTPPSQSLSMLGLGDVVLPGIMIGLALRFDLFLFYLQKQTKRIRAMPSTSPSSNSNAPTRTRSHSRGRGAKSFVDSSKASDVVKAPYQSVAEGWGDRLWTLNFLHLFRRSNSSSNTSTIPNYVARNAFPKPYFHASLIGYIIGMLITLLAMQVSERPQPALLYLVPSVLTALWSRAWSRGEVKAMWDFSDASEESKEDEKAKNVNKESKKSKLDGDMTPNAQATSDGQDVDDEDNEDSPIADRTRNKSPQSSLFSRQRSEARARRLSDALSGARSKSKNKSNTKVEKQQKWFSFSLTFPSLAPTARGGRSAALRVPKKSTANSFDAEEDEDQSPRYSLRNTGRKNEQATKRLRLS